MVSMALNDRRVEWLVFQFPGWITNIRIVSIFSTAAGFDIVSEYFEKQRPDVSFGRKGVGSDGVMVTCQRWTFERCIYLCRKIL